MERMLKFTNNSALAIYIIFNWYFGSISWATVLHAATTLVAMASGKNFWQPKFWRKLGDGDHFTVKGRQKATFWKSELGALGKWKYLVIALALLRPRNMLKTCFVHWHFFTGFWELMIRDEGWDASQGAKWLVHWSLDHNMYMLQLIFVFS